MGSSGGCRDCRDKHPILGSIPIVGKVFRNERSCTSKKIGQQESYDENAQLVQTIRVQETLTEYRLKSERESDALELGVLSESRKNLDDLLVFLGEINSRDYAGQKLNLNLDRIQKDNRKTEDTIRGYIKKKIQKRVSLDDDVCLEILKMDAGERKEKKMREFLDGVFKESMEGLIVEIQKCLREQMERVEDKISTRIDSCTAISEEKIKVCKEIEEIKLSNEHKLEDKLVELEYKQALCVLGLSMIE